MGHPRGDREKYRDGQGNDEKVFYRSQYLFFKCVIRVITNTINNPYRYIFYP